MNIYITYLKRRSGYDLEQNKLSDIVNEIRSPIHSELVKDIRNQQDKEKRNVLKGQLPMFFPTVQIFNKNQLSSNSIPTGVVQFDIDMAENTERNINELKEKVIAMDSVIYAFKSPSGGLKFGLLTDFHKHEGDDIASLKHRYREAYGLCQVYLSDKLAINYDDAVKNIKTACYLSWDESAYFNSDCGVLAVDKDCKYSPPTSLEKFNPQVSVDQVKYFLKWIPKDSKYADRLEVNFTVFASIGGDAGVAILLDHWSKTDKNKLKKQLHDQSRSTQYGSIAQLENIAKRHDYKPIPPAARRKLKARPSSYEFEPMSTVEEAMDKLENVIHIFFKERKSTFVNVSTGLGKTQIALEFLIKMATDKKVLYLVKNHELAEEIKRKFNSIKNDPIIFRDNVTQKSLINHIKGKSHRDNSGRSTCELQGVLKQYEDAGIAMPLQQCTTDCPYSGECNYTLQFDEIGSIRLMTHNELVNKPSAWFHGSAGNEPRKSGWEPDYIIVDEDWMKRIDHVEKIDSEYPSIRNIVNDCLNGIELEEAVNSHSEKVLLDYEQSIENQNEGVLFTNTDQYIADRTGGKRKSVSTILTILCKYVSHGRDLDELQKVRFDETRRILISSHIVPVATRYENIPTLYLDATANEEVVKAVLGEVEFQSIKVKSSDHVNVYQLENYNWTKSRLEIEKNRNKLIRELKPYVERYDSVGIITYKNVKGMRDFDKWLGKELGVTVYDHFGNLRGLDKFQDVDCLLIVGRHMIPIREIEDFENAFFDGVSQFESVPVDIPVRMKNGQSKALNSYVYTDNRLESVKDHFSKSETIQAIGRARLIHGGKKDIFLFSNESLGSAVEISRFFRYEEPKYSDAIKKLKKAGYCETKPASLRGLGLSEHRIKRDRCGIDKEFGDAGIIKKTLKVKDRYRNSRKREFYYTNHISLEVFLELEGVSIQEQSSEET